MTSKSFDIPEKKVGNRISSTLQHKLRVVMKCYTIVDFDIDKEQMTFSFKKTNRIRGIVLKDKKEYRGRYEVTKNDNPVEDKEYNLTIFVG